MNETATARKPSGVYTVAGEVARAIEQHPGETARGLFRLHIERFAEFGIDGTYAAALVQQQLVRLEEQGLVRRQKGATKSAPHMWYWVGGEQCSVGSGQCAATADAYVTTINGPRADLSRPWAEPTYTVRAAIDDGPPVAEPYVAGEPRVGVTSSWKPPAFEVRQAGLAKTARQPAPDNAASPPQRDELTCRMEMEFAIGGTIATFFHAGPWDERVALRLERFLLAVDAEGE